MLFVNGLLNNSVRDLKNKSRPCRLGLIEDKVSQVFAYSVDKLVSLILAEYVFVLLALDRLGCGGTLMALRFDPCRVFLEAV